MSTSEKGKRNLRQYQPTHVGRRRVLRKITLKLGLIGLVLPLCSDPDRRIDDVRDIMADLLEDGFETVPCGTMDKIFEVVSTSSIRLNEPRMDGFVEAIPLRTVHQNRNYVKWDSTVHDWCIKPFNASFVRIEGDNVMIIAVDKAKRRVA